MVKNLPANRQQIHETSAQIPISIFTNFSKTNLTQDFALHLAGLWMFFFGAKHKVLLVTYWNLKLNTWEKWRSQLRR